MMDDEFERELAAKGVFFVTLPDGRKVAENKERPVRCPICQGDPETQPDCSECIGTGTVIHVPWADNAWDEVYPGLYVGGHDAQAGVDCKVADQFDLVVSLYERYGWGPGEGVVHLTHRMMDGELEEGHHSRLHELAEHVQWAIERGEKVLVRCQAGLNRSSLVAALALIKIGLAPEEAIQRIRTHRSPYALFNQHFETYLRSLA